MTQTAESSVTPPRPEVIAEWALKTAFDHMHCRVFFDVCAANGRRPENQKEAQDMLDLNDLLSARVQREKVASGSRYSSILENLSQQVPGVIADPVEVAIKSAADSFLSDPHVYQAVAVIEELNRQAAAA